jgi:hypothetical protein
MATLEYKVVGIRNFTRFTKTFGKTAVPMMRRELYNCADHFDRYVQRSIRNTPKDFSKTYGPEGHHPSKPFHPPASRSGSLLKNMYAERRNYGAVWYVNNAKYAPWLEKGTKEHPITARRKKVLSDGISFFGTEQKVSMKPRPFVGPAIKRNQRYYNDRIRNVALRSIRNAKMGVGL